MHFLFCTKVANEHRSKEYEREERISRIRIRRPQKLRNAHAQWKDSVYKIRRPRVAISLRPHEGGCVRLAGRRNVRFASSIGALLSFDRLLAIHGVGAEDLSFPSSVHCL